MSRFHIREAHLPDDKPAILEFMFALQRFEAAFEANRRLDARMPQDHYAAIIPRAAAPNGQIFIADDAESHPVGWALIHEEVDDVYVNDVERRFGFIAELYVVEAERSAGVGRALIAACETWAQARGLSTVRIGVLARNARAAQVYDRAGYAPYVLHLRKRL